MQPPDPVIELWLALQRSGWVSADNALSTLAVLAMFPFWRALGGILTRWADFQMPGVQHQINALKLELADMRAEKERTDERCANDMRLLGDRLQLEIDKLKVENDVLFDGAVDLRGRLMDAYDQIDKLRQAQMIQPDGPPGDRNDGRE